MPPEQDTDTIGDQEPEDTFENDDQYSMLNDTRTDYGDFETDVEFNTVAPVTVIGRRGRKVTIITNFPLSFNGSVMGVAREGFSGTIPKGATITGNDDNNNNIPDAIDWGIKHRYMKWQRQ